MHATKIVGVTHPNNDGSSRQELLHEVKQRGDQHVILKHEKDNPKSDRAIAVYDIQGRQLGYIDDAVARGYINHIKAQGSARAQIFCIVGGSDGKDYGCEIIILHPGESEVTIVHEPEKSGKAWSYLSIILVIAAFVFYIIR